MSDHFAVDQHTITGRTRLAPDSLQPLFACDDCTLSSGRRCAFFLKLGEPKGWRVARGRAAAGSLMGLGNERPLCGRPAHDHWTNSPSSGQLTATIRL